MQDAVDARGDDTEASEPSHSFLIVAHPGHELLCHGWLETARPTVYCLTSGGGASKIGRKQRSIDLIAATGSSTGAAFGAWSDEEIYEFILDLEVQPLVEWVHLIQADLSGKEGEVMLIGDMLEGYSPAHDLCRHAINCVAELGSVQPRFNLSLQLAGEPSPRPVPGFPLAHAHTNSLEATRRKIEAGIRYYELKDEVEQRIRQTPAHFFSREFFYLTSGLPYQAYDSSSPPFYEGYGRKRVKEGKYNREISFAAHVNPFVARLRMALNLPPLAIPASIGC